MADTSLTKVEASRIDEHAEGLEERAASLDVADPLAVKVAEALREAAAELRARASDMREHRWLSDALEAL